MSMSEKTTTKREIGENLSSKFYSIIMISNYVAYLILVLPFIVLYYFITNPIRRMQNQRRLRKILKKGGVPKKLRHEVSGSYKNFTKIVSFNKIILQRKGLEKEK